MFLVPPAVGAPAVDTTPPQINLSGALADAAQSGVSIGGGEVSVGVDAYDMAAGGLTTDGASGVASVELTIDGTDPNPALYDKTQSCPGGGCGMIATFPVDTATLAAGDHTFTVTATTLLVTARLTRLWLILTQLSRLQTTRRR